MGLPYESRGNGLHREVEIPPREQSWIQLVRVWQPVAP